MTDSMISSGAPDTPDSAEQVRELFDSTLVGEPWLTDMVPGAVTGFRRRQARTRIVSGVASVAVLALGGAAYTMVPASHASNHVDYMSGPLAAPPTTASTSAAPDVAACHGSWRLFGQYNGELVYSADGTGLTNVCDRDIAVLEALIPGAKIVPHSESLKEARAKHDIPVGQDTFAPNADSGTPLVQPGAYSVTVGDSTTLLTFLYGDGPSMFGDCAQSKGCVLDISLPDGLGAREQIAAGGGQHFIDIRKDDTHWVTVMGIPGHKAGTTPALPYDFGTAVHAKAFADLVTLDFADLTLVTHPR